MINKKRGNLKPNKNSIVLNLNPILTIRNIDRPAAYLIRIGLNPTSVNKMLKSEAVQINFKQMTTLCTHLNCTPNDLFSLRDMHLDPNHQLLKLRNLDQTVNSPLSIFEGKSMEEVEAMMMGVAIKEN